MFNAQLSMVIMFGLVGMVLVNVAIVYVMAKQSEKAIEAEVLKANKRLSDQISSRIG